MITVEPYAGSSTSSNDALNNTGSAVCLNVLDSNLGTCESHLDVLSAPEKHLDTIHWMVGSGWIDLRQTDF
jgi:hypothetical protein